LSSLAIFEYFNGNFAAGDLAQKEAVAKAPAKSEAKSIEKQLFVYRNRAKQYRKGLEKVAKAEQKQSKESLQNPFGGLGGSPAGG
jgi:hypothetical protein